MYANHAYHAGTCMHHIHSQACMPSMHAKHLHAHQCMSGCASIIHILLHECESCACVTWMHWKASMHACIHVKMHASLSMRSRYACIGIILVQACAYYACTSWHACMCMQLLDIHAWACMTIMPEQALHACFNINAEVCTHKFSCMSFIHALHAWHDMTYMLYCALNT